MVFIDVGRKLGAGEVGSANLALSAAENEKLGTFSLKKAIGTLSSASIGSLHLSYGSAGTHAGGLVRHRAGSFVGSVYARKFASVQGSVVALRVGTLSQRAFGSLQGSSYLRRFVSPQGTVGALRVGTLSLRAFGSAQGTFYARRLVSPQGSIGALRVGTLDVRSSGSFQGTVSGHRLVFPLGSIQGSLYVRKLSSLQGSVGALRVGTFSQRAFGSLQGSSYLRRFVSPQGTVGAIRVGTLSVRAFGSFRGTVTAHNVYAVGYGSFGTSAGRIARYGQGSFVGSLSAHQVRIGSTLLVGTGARVSSARTVIRGRTIVAVGTRSSNTELFDVNIGTPGRIDFTASRPGANVDTGFGWWVLTAGGAVRGMRLSGSQQLMIGTFGNVEGARAKVAGTLLVTRFGSVQGTFYSRKFSSLQGSFGALRVGSLTVRAAGSFQGSVSGHRLAVRYPGTTTVRVTGTLKNWFGAPNLPRFMTIAVRSNPSAASASGAVLRQSLSGTLALCRSPANATVEPEDFSLSAWVLPGRGSYALVTNGAGTPTTLFWREWDP